MPNKTDIEWVLGPDGTRGYTWNPVTGCKHGCSYCYARRMALRLRGRYGYPQDKPFDPTFHPDRLEDPQKFERPVGIFVCSMADLFGEWVPKEWINEVLGACWKAPKNVYYFLTKDIERLAALQQADELLQFPPHSFVGVTVDNPSRLSLISLEGIKAEKRFISFEPLIGQPRDDLEFKGVDWAILGAMTGQRPVYPGKTWATTLTHRLWLAGIPYWVKDNYPWVAGPRPRHHPLYTLECSQSVLAGVV